LKLNFKIQAGKVVISNCNEYIKTNNNNNNNNNTHNLAKTITDKQNKYQELANEICAVWKQNTA